MSSCLSGGGRAPYGFHLQRLKSPSSTSTIIAASHNTASPSSTLSESTSQLTVSTRKPRTARKRPNQTYNEAATLLSTAYPNIFSTKNLSTKNSNSHQQLFGIKPRYHNIDFHESSDCLLPFGDTMSEADLLIYPRNQAKSDLFFGSKEVNLGREGMITGEIDVTEPNPVASSDDFDAESILDEEIGEGIDSIMGNVRSNNDDSHKNDDSIDHQLNSSGNFHEFGRLGQMMMNSWYGNPMRIGFSGNFKLRFELRSALRHYDDANWWRFPAVDFAQISPKSQNTATTTTSNNDNKGTTNVAIAKNKKQSIISSDSKKKKVDKPPSTAKSKSSESGKEGRDPEPRSGLLLKLNYDGVVEAWSDRPSPFSDEVLESDAAGTDVHGRLAEIDLLAEDGVREASLLRYKEKRRTRLYYRKIRYQVRKAHADQRPRLKGRFMRRPQCE